MGTNAQASLHPDWVCGLLEPDAYPHAVSALRLIETHISWVFLTGTHVYKVKKPVNFGFVNFSTLQLRRFYCEEEIRLNRRTTTDLYLGVVPIALVGGRPVIGQRPAMEYAVHMRQFPAGARLDRWLDDGMVTSGQFRQLARLLAEFHNNLTPIKDIKPGHAATRASTPALNNFGHISGSHISRKSQERIQSIHTWTLQQAEALGPVFRQRTARGYIRECHGDLHLANLFVQDQQIFPFDSLEFNADLRCIDQVSDIAFLVMDLMARGRQDLAYVFLNAWLEASGDYDGLAVLRFYLVYRCMVRLKVASIQAQQLHEGARGEHAIKARHYLELARSLMNAPAQPALVLMHGLSGSGKTYQSELLIKSLPAIRVRSDLERKRLPGISQHPPTDGEIDTGLYSKSTTDRTYRTLSRYCQAGIRAGFNMIADATFLFGSQRRIFHQMARRLNAGFAIVSCEAPVDILKERIRRRLESGRDESDADAGVLNGQMDSLEPLNPRELEYTLEKLQTPTPLITRSS